MLRRGEGSCVSYRNPYNFPLTASGATDRVSTWSLNPTTERKERPCMAQEPPAIHFEDIPLAEARTMGRGPRMDPDLYHAFKEKIQSLDNTATRITIPEGTSPTTMKNRILRVAAELRIPLTIRKVPGGLLFWRSTAEDLEQAKEIAQRLQPARRKGRGRPGQRRR
jgi:hypothetical protein